MQFVGKYITIERLDRFGNFKNLVVRIVFSQRKIGKVPGKLAISGERESFFFYGILMKYKMLPATLATQQGCNKILCYVHTQLTASVLQQLAVMHSRNENIWLHLQKAR